jgi:Fic-DOC domain mobile mystery protein B
MGVWQAIPGETPIDPSDLKDRSITTRKELSKAEALNIRKAHIKYLGGSVTKRLAPFDYTWLLRLHEEMFCDVWTWAGKLRHFNLNLGIKWDLISDQLYSLAQDIPFWVTSNMPLVEQATRLHYRGVQIHPFSNGNGRWSRLLANIWLKRNKSPIVIWPEETIGQESVIRDNYIKALHDADKGVFDSLIALHAQYQNNYSNGKGYQC